MGDGHSVRGLSSVKGALAGQTAQKMVYPASGLNYSVQ